MANDWPISFELIQTNLAAMRETEKLCDMYLVGSDFETCHAYVATHSCIMVAASKFLFKMFAMSNARLNEGERVLVESLSTAELAVMVGFIYGKKVLTNQELEMLEKAAHSLDVSIAFDYVSYRKRIELLHVDNQFLKLNGDETTVIM